MNERCGFASGPMALSRTIAKRKTLTKDWYRYDTRFDLPVYAENGDIERYNVFTARLLIRHASSGKKYLYDILEIKKETSKSCQE